MRKPIKLVSPVKNEFKDRLSDFDVMKMALKGVYNEEVYVCPDCSHSLWGETFDCTIGIANSNRGLMAIVECPKCFTKYYSHFRENQYSTLWFAIDFGQSKFYTIEDGKIVRR